VKIKYSNRKRHILGAELV